MTDERVDEIIEKCMPECRIRLDNAHDTGSAGEVYSIACDITTELVSKIIRLESELDHMRSIKEVRND